MTGWPGGAPRARASDAIPLDVPPRRHHHIVPSSVRINITLRDTAQKRRLEKLEPSNREEAVAARAASLRPRRTRTPDRREGNEDAPFSGLSAVSDGRHHSPEAGCLAPFAAISFAIGYGGFRRRRWCISVSVVDNWDFWWVQYHLDGREKRTLGDDAEKRGSTALH